MWNAIEIKKGQVIQQNWAAEKLKCATESKKKVTEKMLLKQKKHWHDMKQQKNTIEVDFDCETISKIYIKCRWTNKKRLTQT